MKNGDTATSERQRAGQTAGEPHSVDCHVGRRLRERRWLLGLSLEAVAGRVGIKAQQVQKYETGINRISASRLWELAEVLGVPAAYFFEGLEHRAPHGADLPGDAEIPGDPLSDKEAAALVRAYYAMPAHQRRRLFELARALGEAA